MIPNLSLLPDDVFSVLSEQGKLSANRLKNDSKKVKRKETKPVYYFKETAECEYLEDFRNCAFSAMNISENGPKGENLACNSIPKLLSEIKRRKWTAAYILRNDGDYWSVNQELVNEWLYSPKYSLKTR